MFRRAEAVEILTRHDLVLEEGFPASPMQFYDRLEAVLIRYAIPGVRIRRITWREGAWGSARRTYLRIERKRLVVDVGAAPFGPGGVYFISWYLGLRTSAWREFFSTIPLFRLFAFCFHRPYTMYNLDTNETFQHCVQAAIHEVVEQLTAASRQPLQTEEQPPLREDFYKW